MKKFEYKSFTFAYMENDSIAGSDIKVLNKLGGSRLGGDSDSSCETVETSWASRKLSGYFKTRNRKINIMYLHEAMEKLFRQVGRSMTTKEIAEKLNENKWYRKADGSLITPYQIYGRAKGYPELFYCEGSTISLKGSTTRKIAFERTSKQHVRISQNTVKDSVLVEKMLMNKQNFKSAKDVDGFVPQASGLYCIRIKNVHLLPEPFGTILLERGHDILYIGIASENLYNRFLNQELRAKGHGTFFRSMGAVLGTSPRKDR